MEIRLIGPNDLVSRLHSLARKCGVSARVYPSRGSASESRLYLRMDDRQAEMMIESLETCQNSPARKTP